MEKRLCLSSRNLVTIVVSVLSTYMFMLFAVSQFDTNSVVADAEISVAQQKAIPTNFATDYLNMSHMVIDTNSSSQGFATPRGKDTPY